jgi:transcriptional regulator with XRE-family HTH domain
MLNDLCNALFPTSISGTFFGTHTGKLQVFYFTPLLSRVYVYFKSLLSGRPGYAMGNFGEDLRMERVARGIALEEITAVTKISQRHLLALEQERFRQLPGGILNKGILRGYVSAVGLDCDEWMQRYLRAYQSSGEMSEDDRDWMAFATNVGKARLDRHEMAAMRIRWAFTILLFLFAVTACFIAVRYFGLRAHWWPNLFPNWLHFGLHLPNSIHNWIYR